MEALTPPTIGRKLICSVHTTRSGRGVQHELDLTAGQPP